MECRRIWGKQIIWDLKVTEELVELCHIDYGKYVLDVGCGVGITACNLSERHGCRVIGVDMSDRMIAWGLKKGRKERVSRIDSNSEQRTRKTTFGDALFDVVICESVTVFLDKQQAVSEYVRVAKLGDTSGLMRTRGYGLRRQRSWLHISIAQWLKRRFSLLTSGQNCWKSPD